MKIKFFCFAYILLLSGPFRVYTHPHVLIESSLRLVVSDNGLEGIKMRWVFSEAFTNMIKTEFDRDQDGRLNESEITRIRDGAFSNLREYDYFTRVKMNDRVQRIQDARNFTCLYENDSVIYSFYLPLDITADSKANISISLRDETYYSSIVLIKGEPVQIENGDSFLLDYEIRKHSQDTESWGIQKSDEIILKLRKRAD